LGWTKDALKGTIQASLWCITLPFVIVAILSFVGNSFDLAALRGEFVGSQMDTIIWLFGVTLLLLISPLITQGMIRGDGVHAAGAKVGSMMVNSGTKTMMLLPSMLKLTERVTGKNLSAIGSGTKIFKQPAANNLKEAKKDSMPDQDKSKETKSNQRTEVKSSEGKVEAKGQDRNSEVHKNKEKTQSASNSSRETKGGDKTQTRGSAYQAKNKGQNPQKNNVSSPILKNAPTQAKRDEARGQTQTITPTQTYSKTQSQRIHEVRRQSGARPETRSVKRELR